MIDWLTLRLHCTGLQIDGGRVMSIDVHGNIEWQALKRAQVRGSHESSVALRTMPHDGSLEIAGNPAKWLQGHNIFGTDDLVALAQKFARRVVAAAGHTLRDEAEAAIEQGCMPLTRVDVTESFDFGTQSRAVAAVQAISDRGHFKHRGRGSMLAEGTCYFGQKSRRLAAKMYAKGLELTKHKLPCALAHRSELLDLAAGLVRFEFTLRSMWLKDRGLETVRNWPTLGVTPAGLHAELLAKLNISEVTMRETANVADLPPRLQGVYQAWLDGHDVRAMFKAKATFYRYRSQLLLMLGVDIAVKRPRAESNVVPLRVVLTGRPLDVPEWAKGTPLYFEPRAA